MPCSICNSVSKSPEDSRLSEHHPSFLEVVGDFTDTSCSFSQLFLFVCHQLLLFSQPIRSLLVAGFAGVTVGLQSLDFSMPFVFAIALVDFLFSFSIQIACFSLKVCSLVFILVCVFHQRMQDSEYRSKGYN